jgi:hypothetical protein
VGELPIIYIAGAFTAPTPAAVRDNIRVAALWGHRVRQLGCAVMVPHLLGTPYVAAPVALLHDSFGYDWWIKETLEHMRRTDGVFFCPGWQSSKGSVGEFDEAVTLGKPVFFEFAELAEWMAERVAA